MKNNNMNYKLNFLKGIACMGVIFIHITFPGMFGQIIKYASAYAVPIFFMTAGYYAMGGKIATVKRRLNKIIKYFIYAYILFLGYNLLIAVKNHTMMTWISVNFNAKTLIKYICFCTIDFAVPLWYLISMIELYIIWYFIVKKQKEQSALKLIPILFILQILLTSYCETMQLQWFWKINVITRALPWFLLGYYIRTNEGQQFKSIDTYKLLGMVVIGCIIVLTPIIFHTSIQFSALGYIPYATGMFVLTLKNPNHHICKVIEYIGANLSLNIYILHVLVANALEIIYYIIFKNNIGKDIWLWYKPVITLMCTVSISWGICVVLRYRQYNKKLG